MGWKGTPLPALALWLAVLTTTATASNTTTHTT
jgi:hypothetical protein